MWALGVVYYRVICGRFPFDCESRNREMLFKRIRRNSVSFPENVAAADRELILKMMRSEPAKRIDLDSLIIELGKLID